MANRTAYPVKTLEVSAYVVAFSFAPNGTSAVDQTSIVGRGIKSVARDAVGDFTVTLEDKWPALLGAHFTISHNADTDVVPQIASEDVGGATPKIVIRVLAGATPTDIAAHANNRIYGTLILRNSGVA